jgi:hypothetical protein
MTRDLIVSRLSGALALLAQAKDATDAKHVADLARAVEVYARRQELGDEAIAYATAIKVDAMTLMGEFLKAAPKNKGTAGEGRPRKGGPKREPPKNGAATQEELFGKGGKKVASTAQALATIKAEDPALHEEVRGGQVSPEQACHELRRRRRQQAKEAAEAEYQAAQAAGGDVQVTIAGSWSGRNYDALRAEVFARPAFADRQAETRRLGAEAGRLWDEAERLQEEAEQTQRLAREAALDLEDSVLETMQAEHGPIVHPGERTYRIRDREALNEYLGIEGEEERREWLLERSGLCPGCGTEPGPESRYLYCAWCREHRGRTHCDECGAPLQEGEEGCCRQCAPPEEPESAEEIERRARLAWEFFRQFGPLPDLFGPEPAAASDPGDGPGDTKPRGRKAKGK